MSRLTPQQGYDRIFRIKRASQASVVHKPLPKDQWIKPEEVRLTLEWLADVLTRDAQDIRYLKPHVVEVAKEDSERQAWDHIVVAKK